MGSLGKSFALVFVALFLTALVVLPPALVKAESKTIVVPDDYSTIKDAIFYANEGDTVYVKKGTYQEQTLTINKKLSILGEDVEDTIISLHPPWVDIGGLHLTGSGVEPFYGYDNPIKITANNVIISGFKIISNVSSTLRISGAGTLMTGNYIAAGLLLENAGQNITGNTVNGEITCIGNNHTIADNILRGVFVLSSGILIENNSISGDIGIQMGSYGNTVFNNTIKECGTGISFWSYAADNLFYGNNFINNTRQIQIGDTYNPVVGRWDNGYALGGNYWSDYSAKYSNAVEIDDSGIGDKPYIIDAKNIDHFPLLNPYFGEEANSASETFPTMLIAIVAVVVVALVVAGLLVYHKKHKHNSVKEV
jgi:parallel beta-helix repeat protein